MSARRWVLLGLFAVVLTFWSWRRLSREPLAPETDDPSALIVKPVLRASRAVVPVTPLIDPADAGEWNVEVVDARDGAPLAGASVEVGYSRREWSRCGTTTARTFRSATDARGHALMKARPATADEMEDEATQPFKIFVDHEFFHSYEGPYVPGMQVVLEARPSWRGRVMTSTGEPATGARVIAIDAEDVETYAAADGSFELAMAWPGRVFATLGDEFTVARAVDDHALDLTLHAAEPRQGRVIGRDGGPLADVVVTMQVQDFSRIVTAGADGVFRVPKISDFEPSLRFEKPGYVTEEGPFKPEVTLSRPARLEGTFVDERGKPIPLEELEVGVPTGPYSHRLQTTKTDAAGRFAFDALSVPQVVLEAVVGEDSEARLTVTLAEGGLTKVTLALVPHGTEVRLEYVSVAEVPVRRCQTTAWPAPSAGWSSSSDINDDIMLAHGRFHFEVHCDDGRVANETRDADPRNEPVLRFVVRRPDGGTPLRDELPPDVVQVKVVTPEGEPIAGASLNCGGKMAAETGADGRAKCEVREEDNAWPLVIRASKGDAQGLVRATGKEDALIVLRSPGVLRGRVDGPIPPGFWTIAVRSAIERSNTTLEGAAFELEHRLAIRTSICIEGVGDQHPTLGCAISEAGEPVVIRVGEMGKISFTAIDAAGAPISKPIIYFNGQGRFVNANASGEVVLDAAPGEHVLILNVADSRARNETRLTVRPGEVTALGPLKLE